MRVVARVAGDEVKHASLLADVAVGGGAVALLHARLIEEFAQRNGALEVLAVILVPLNLPSHRLEVGYCRRFRRRFQFHLSSRLNLRHRYRW